MHTGYDNYWLGQTGRQEPPPNLQKTNTPRNALLTVGYNNYKPMPNQTQHAMRTGRYPDYVNNYIPPQNGTPSSTNKVAGTQSKGQNPHLFWTPSVMDGPPPPPTHTYPPQELISPQAKSLHYPPQASQRLQNNFEPKTISNSDPGFPHFYIGNFNSNNYYNSSSNVSGNQGISNNNNGLDKTARIRVRNIFSLNNPQTGSTQISGNNVYNSREQYNCPLNYLPMRSRKENPTPNPYENVNLPPYRSLNLNVTEQYEYPPTNQQDTMQGKSYQQRNAPMAPESQFHYNGTRVNENNVPLAPASGTVIPSSSNASTCRVGVDKIVRVDPVRIAAPASSYGNTDVNLTDNYFMNVLSSSSSSSENPTDRRFDVPPPIQTSNERGSSSNSAIPSHYQGENNGKDTTLLHLRNLLNQKLSSQHDFNAGQSVVRNSSSSNNNDNNINDDDSNSNIVINNEVEVNQTGPSLNQIICAVLDGGEKTQSSNAPSVTPNTKRPSSLTLENSKCKILKKDEQMLTVVEADSQGEEIKVEINDELKIMENFIPKSDPEDDLIKVEEGEKEKNEQSESETVKHLRKSSANESVVNHLTDGDIERSIFFSKKPGPKSKTMPEALQAAKNRIETFEKLQNTENGDEEQKKLSLKYEHKINRDKLNQLKEYIISLKKIDKICESDDSVRSCESVCSNKEINKEAFNRRRKVSKSSIVKNRNNSREMISLVSHKNGKIEMCERVVEGSKSDNRGDNDSEQMNGVHNEKSESPPNDKHKHEAKERLENISPQDKTKTCIITSPKKKDSFEETAIINTMRAFQNLEYHYCMSCDLVSSNSSFWINAVTAELRCLNCFKKMALPTEKGKSESEELSGEHENNHKTATVLDMKEAEVPLKKLRKEMTEKRQMSRSPVLGKSKKPERYKRKNNFKEEDKDRGKHTLEECKKKETELLNKSRKMSNEECGAEKVLEEPVSTKQVESADTNRRKSLSKDEGGNLKPHVMEEKIKKDTKQSGDTLERSKRKSVLWEEGTINSEELPRKEKNMTEKTKRKNIDENEPIIQKLRNVEKEKPKKKKEEVTPQRGQKIMETVNELKNIIEDKERRRSEEKWRKYYTERDTKIFLMKLSDKDEGSEGKRRKPGPKEKENKKNGSLSPREKKDTKGHEHKREQKKEDIDHAKEGKLLSGEEPEETKIKRESSQAGKITQNSKGESLPKGQTNHPQNGEKLLSKKEHLLKSRSKDTGTSGKGDSVLFAQLLKKTKKLSKSLLGETQRPIDC